MRQFEDLQVNDDGMGETDVGGEIEVQEVEEGTDMPPCNVPVDMEMEVIEDRTHLSPTDLPSKTAKKMMTDDQHPY